MTCKSVNLFQLKPHNVGVSIAFPPDTDTPGFENENQLKVCSLSYFIRHLSDGILSYPINVSMMVFYLIVLIDGLDCVMFIIL